MFASFSRTVKTSTGLMQDQSYWDEKSALLFLGFHALEYQPHREGVTAWPLAPHESLQTLKGFCTSVHSEILFLLSLTCSPSRSEHLGYSFQPFTWTQLGLTRIYNIIKKKKDYETNQGTFFFIFYIQVSFHDSQSNFTDFIAHFFLFQIAIPLLTSSCFYNHCNLHTYWHI